MAVELHLPTLLIIMRRGTGTFLTPRNHRVLMQCESRTKGGFGRRCNNRSGVVFRWCDGSYSSMCLLHGMAYERREFGEIAIWRVTR